MTNPYTVRLTVGLTRAALAGFNLKHPYNKEAKVSWSDFIDLMRYRPDGYKFMPKFQEGSWDGYIYMMYESKKTGSITFPCGLAKKVTDFFVSKGVNVETKFAYSWQCPLSVAKLNGVTLRGYQKDAANAGLQYMRGIIKAPTGSGKTKIGTAIINTVRARTIWMTHKKDLLYQTQNSLRKDLGVPIGIVGDGKRDWRDITICSVKTIFQNFDEFKERLNSTVMLFGDEIHRGSSTEWYNVMKQIPAIYRLGLSATPLKGDKFVRLEATTGPIIYNAKSTKLIKKGYLSKPHIFMIKYKRKPLPDNTEYKVAIRSGLSHNKRRNKLIARVAVELAKIPGLSPIAIQCRRIAHLRMIRKRIKETNLSYTCISGKDSAQKRQKAFKRIEDDKLDVMIISTVFDEGIDITNIRTVIRASEGKGWENTIQILGRGMRIRDDKSSVIVVDFYDTSHEYLEKQSKARIRSYKSEGHTVKVVTIEKFKREIVKLIKQRSIFGEGQ